MSKSFVFAYFAVWITVTTAGSIRYCIPRRAVNSFHGLRKACDKIHKAQHEIQCIVAADRLSCLKLLSVGKADFMVAEPEDLRVMSAYNESTIVVTHQLKKFAESEPQMEVEMVVVVKSDSDSVLTTKRKKLCYIGLETSRSGQFNYYYTNYFESWLFPRSCDPNKSQLENRIASLSGHFEAACVAGPWSLDRKMDADLKYKYKNLCALCGNPRSCDDDDRYYGPTGALMCLRQGIGNVAWLSISEARKYFSLLGSYGFSLLCPDGTARDLYSSTNDTCTWITDPRPVIVANKKVARIVLDKVSDSGEERNKFYQVIHSSYIFSYLKKLEKPMSTKEYLLKLPGYWSALVKNKSTCRSEHVIRWCISSSLEARKCQSLRRASNALGLRPSFTCVQMPSRDQCIRAVIAFQSDVFVAKPDEKSKWEKLGLKSIIEMLPNKKDEQNNVVAVVRKEARFQTLKDLKNAKACFSGYRSVGWNAVYLALKNDSDQRSSSSDIEIISTFFKDSCVLNIDSKNHSFPKNLYSICKIHHDASNLTLEESTFKCLEDGADVTFVNVSAIRAYASRNVVFNFKYRLLCPKNEFLDEQSSCFLAKVTLGSILVSKNISRAKEDDVFLTFMGLNRYFGRTFDRETPMFEMYGPYEDESNVLFADATVKLQRALLDVQYVSCNEEFARDLPKVRKPHGNFPSNAMSYSKQAFQSILAMCHLVLAVHFFIKMNIL